MIATSVDHLWQSTWCALAIWIWLTLWRRGFASVRHGFLLLASVKFLLPLAVLYALGARAGYPVRYPEDLPPTSIMTAVNTTQPLSWPAAYLPAPRIPGWGSALLAAAWGAGMLFCATRWLSSWRMARRAVRLSTPLPYDKVSDSALETRASPAVTVPSVVGAFRPVLLLPAGAESKLDGVQLAAVFAFAKEYARRRYYAKAQLQRLVETLVWFHPLVWWIGRALPHEAARACDETILAADCDAAAYSNGLLAAASIHQPPDVDWILRGAQAAGGSPPRPLGFVRGMAVAACLYAVPLQAAIAGAVHDRLHRHEVMLADVAALRMAPLEMNEAAPGMGDRMQMISRADGVLIRNANLRELLAISYGVTRFDVIANQMKSSLTTDDDVPHWLYWPRYDVHVRASLREPALFDGYALHERMTAMLVERFGFEINVNGKCQEPCGRFAPALPQTGAAPK